MPDEWGRNGGRLLLRLNARFQPADDEPIDEPILMPFGSSDRDATAQMKLHSPGGAGFVGMHGEETVRVRGKGDACCQASPTAMASGMCHLRFWIDLESSLCHHDVELPAGRHGIAVALAGR